MMAAVALAGMGTPASATGPSPDHPPETRSYIFSYLVLDEPEKLSQEEMGEAMQGHFANMGDMADAGDLLIAGPLADPRIDETYRGIFVFSTDDIGEGRALVATDPGVKAGVFKPELYVISCDEPLGELTRLEREYEQRRLDDPDIPDEWVGRMFVLAIGPGDEEFEHTDAVLIDATMDRVDDNKDEVRQLLWLDASDVEEARSKLKAEHLDAWSFYGWYGSPCVAELKDIN
tara:strand:- start:15430 stop:16125 length:696 start_codon:yes stop_codon:yes gene_type:complete